MGSTSPLAAPRPVNGLKFHVEELESYFEQSLEFLLPHVEAILCEMESRIPPEELLPPEPILPVPLNSASVAFSTKKNRSKKNRPATSSSPPHISHPSSSHTAPYGVQRTDLHSTSTRLSGLHNSAASQFSSVAVTSHPESSSNFSEHSQNYRRNKNKKALSSTDSHSSNHRQVAHVNSSLHMSRNSAAISSISSPNEFPHSTSVSTFSRPYSDYDFITFEETHATSQQSPSDDWILLHGSARTSAAMTTTTSSNPNSEGLSSTSPASSSTNQPAASSSSTGSSSEGDNVAARFLGAAKRGSVEDVLSALEDGAIVSCRDNTGKTALHLAAWNGHADIVALLLTNGADANNRANTHAYTPLHVATMAGHPQCVAFLIDAGVEVDCTSKNGSTPLHMAAMSGHEMIVHILVAAGASRTLKDESGKTAFDMADTNAIQEVLIL